MKYIKQFIIFVRYVLFFMAQFCMEDNGIREYIQTPAKGKKHPLEAVLSVRRCAGCWSLHNKQEEQKITHICLQNKDAKCPTPMCVRGDKDKNPNSEEDNKKQPYCMKLHLCGPEGAPEGTQNAVEESKSIQQNLLMLIGCMWDLCLLQEKKEEVPAYLTWCLSDHCALGVRPPC